MNENNLIGWCSGCARVYTKESVKTERNSESDMK